MKFDILILITALLLGLCYSQDYCAQDLCPPGKKHIACGSASMSFAANCPKNAKIVSLAPYQSLILRVHNTKRNLIASGGLKGYDSASRMATMQWNDELAYLASLNVHQCVMKHDQCRNTPTFPKSGQNIGFLSYTGAKNRKTLPEILTNRINAFFNEYKNANMSIIRRYPENYSGSAKIGHFTVMVAENNYRVGCAVAEYFQKLNCVLFACNYATTNIGGQPVYVSGPPAKRCMTGRNPALPSLCSTKEVY